MTTIQPQCTYDNFNPANLTNLKPDQKTPKTKPGQNPIPPYFIINLQYNLGTDEKPMFSEFDMEFCELTSNMGVMKSNFNNTEGGNSNSNNDKESIKVFLNEDDDEQVKLVETIEAMYKRGAILLEGVKGAVKRHTFKASEAGSVFKYPIHFPLDELTGERLPGKQGSMYLKLFSRGTGPFANETKFYDPDGNPIEKDLLIGVQMKFTPIVAIRSIFIGNVICFQMEMKSAIVSDIQQRNSSTNQLATIERLKQKDPNIASKVSGQLAKLQMARRNQNLIMTNDHVQNTNVDNVDKDDNTSTVSNINPVQLNTSTIPTDLQDVLKNPPKRKLNFV
ncbi:MAG TPA: DUF2738 domain-containing protein [Candidatus Saccharimonadales bacterium]|nr:DUF2738 domain-containing protein [Candidatus Saccharimonadales bacterium]